MTRDPDGHTGAPCARNAAEARRFLSALYGPAPRGHLSLWTGRDKRSHWPADLAAAAERAALLARDNDVYFGVGMRRRPLAAGRGRAKDVLCLPALWADLDIAGPAHHAANLPPDRAAASRTASAPR